MNNLETQIAGIIEYYYPTEQNHNILWEIVCDDLDIDYEDETNSKIFDTIMKQYK